MTSNTETTEGRPGARNAGAEDDEEGYRWRTAGARPAEEGEAGEEGHPGEEGAQSQERREVEGERRSPRGQQDGPHSGTAEAARWRHSQRADESYRLAGAFRTRVPVGDRRQEDGPDGRFHQRRGRRAQLLDQGLKVRNPVFFPPLGFGPAALLVLQDSKFRPSIGKRQAQALEIGIPREEFGFDDRDLATAAFDSCCLGPPQARDLREGLIGAFEGRVLTRVLFPSPNDAVRVFRVDLHEPRLSVPPLACDERRARSTEQVGDDIACFAAVD
jgi:hypothetical protein